MRAEIARQRLTRRKIAEQAHLTERQLRRYLNDESPLPLATYYKLCDVLGIDPSSPTA